MSAEEVELILQAVLYNNEELLRELLTANPNIKNSSNFSRTSSSSSPLHIASTKGYTACVKALLEAQCDVDSISGLGNYLKTPLLLASENGHSEVVEVLIDAGADLFYCDSNGHSALQLAQMNGHEKTAEVLMNSLQRIDKAGTLLRKELCKACIDGDCTTVYRILAEMPKQCRQKITNGTSPDEKSALYLACEHGRADIVQALLTLPGHIIIFGPTGDNVLHAAVASQDSETVEVVLNKFPFLMDAANNDGNLPLHWACRCGNLNVVKLMLEMEYPEDECKFYEDNRGIETYKFICDLNSTDNECRTPLYLAVANGHTNIVYYLVNFKIELFKEGSEPFIGCPFSLDIYCSNGRTALMTACGNGYEEIVRILLDNNVDVNLPIALTEKEIRERPMEEARCAGSGALVEAAKAENLKLIKLLLKRGALDYDNRALAVAVSTGKQDIISIFLNQLSFVDSEYRINKKIPLDVGISVSGSGMLNSTNLLSNIFPSTAVEINWHGTTLSNITVDYLTSAVIKFNSRLRHSKMALAAITRLDLSLNRLAEVPTVIFQLQSLRTLDLSQNLIQKFEIPGNELNVPCLETLNLESNFITSLPGTLFSKSFPNLKTLNMSGNRLRLIPPIVWTAPKLKDLNLSNNEIIEICTISVQTKARKSAKEAHQERMESRISKLKEKSKHHKLQMKQEAEDKLIEKELIRLNKWQKSIQLSNIDDIEDDEQQEVSSEIFSNSLRILNLSSNKLNSVPESLACCCPKLTRLDLSMNNISYAGSVECLPSSLRHLNLSHNRLTKIFIQADPKNLICQAPSIPGSETKQRPLGGNRHSRSRSRSVARNQRSLSVTRTPEGSIPGATDVCPHKSHCRFEALKTLNLSHNELTQLELFVGFGVKNDFATFEQFNLKENSSEMRSYLIFPALTNLDISYNSLKFIPSTVSLLSYLAALNLSGNKDLESLPYELGLLDKLWNISLKDCPMKEPLKNIVCNENYKTVDLIAFLRNKLENSKSYSKLKLMIFGNQGTGKSQILNQLRSEGNFSKKNIQSESWSRRMGHSPPRSSKIINSNKNNSTASAVDVTEWTYEPKKSSKSLVESIGPVTFRTWDFDSKIKESYAVCQYFLSRRSIYLVLWKSTDGEIAINEIQEWLLLIQSRAPNSTVIIVGTHFDAVEENPNRFPENYLENLQKIINEKFVNISDSDKKGLPRVLSSVFASLKTKYNIKNLCNLIYQAASELKTTGRKSKLLTQKVPAIFIAFEKVVVSLTDELRSRNQEPILRFSDFWNISSTKIIEEFGRPFRDQTEFRQALNFLHENGILMFFDETFLGDFCFLDPPWLCNVLNTLLSTKANHENSITSYSELNSSLKQFSTFSPSDFGRKNLLKYCIFKILSRFETALPCQNKLYLIPSSLPDEYFLRADYPGAKIRLKTKNSIFNLIFKRNSSCTSSPTKKNIFHRKLAKTFGVKHSSKISNSGPPESPKKVKIEIPKNLERKLIFVQQNPKDNLRRLFVMQYVPPGFWPRLITRILDDEKITQTIGKMFIVESNDETPLSSSRRSSSPRSESIQDPREQVLTELLNKDGFEFLLWKTGLEVDAFGTFLFSLKQFLPLANVRDVNYSLSEFKRRGDDGIWRNFQIEQGTLIELLVPSFRVKVKLPDGGEFTLKQDRTITTRLLAVLVNIIDDLLEDWFPALGTRFVHTSEGRLLVDRLVPCPECASGSNPMKSQKSMEIENYSVSNTPPRSQTLDNFETITKSSIYLFSIEECILASRELENSESVKNEIICPKHDYIVVEKISPDVTFLDLNENLCLNQNSIKKGKLMGRGAFGFVFDGFVKKNEVFSEVALKILEPVEPGPNAKSSAKNAFEAFMLKWKNDALENCARSYCTARQELNLLVDINHQNVTCLIGFSPRPLTIAVELAPLGALNQILSKYRRSDSRLSVDCLQQVCIQISKALEYLHQNRIIYRDLKSENVLVWRFPLPRSTSDVLVKLGDYGISRFSYPSGVCKGYGGTEGFMAPEVMRFNGEKEYNEKIDCFSFGMFLYELISLKQPYDGQEQMKDFILDGGRPFLSDKELLVPSNILDLMVSCWSEDSESRPTASQIVEITSAPEFCQILDVVLIENDISTDIGSLVSLPPESISTNSNNLNNSNFWLKKHKNAMRIFSCSPFGWLETKEFKLKNFTEITSITAVDENTVWLGDYSGSIRVYSNSNLEELDRFWISELDPAFNQGEMSIKEIVAFTERQVALVTLLHSVLILSCNGAERPTFVSSIELAEKIYVTAIAPSIGNWQIWTGHENGKMIVHNINGIKTQLIYSASVNHSSPSKLKSTDLKTLDTAPVKFIVSSSQNSNLIWSSVQGGSLIYFWENCVIRKTLDCRKLFPVSETLSSMNMDAVRESHITALCSLNYPYEQILVGTSSGLVIFINVKDLSPISAFRPFSDTVDLILSISCAPFSNLLNQREPSMQSLNSLSSGPLGTPTNLNTSGPSSTPGPLGTSAPISNPSALIPSGATGSVEKKKSETSSSSISSDNFNDYLSEAVSKMKSMFSSKKSSSDESLDSYFIVVGNNYRPLLGRFLNEDSEGLNESSGKASSENLIKKENQKCAIAFRTKQWDF